jgi:peptide/nickel transport system substrate-binding protein
VSKGPFGGGGGLGPGPTKRGGNGTIKILYWQAPTILNPHLTQGTKDSDISRLVYEPLADFDGNDTLVPWLAAEIPSQANGGVAADGKSVTWKLKPGVKWSDGQPFTANDVVFTWKYASDDATAASSIAAFAAIDTVEAVNDTTVKVNFKEPTPGWYVPFTGPNGMIIAQHVFQDGIGAAAKNFPANLAPIGTGPYQLIKGSFSPGDSASFEINPNWRDANGPFYDRVDWKGGGDATSAARAVLQTGEYNIAWNLQVDAATLNQLSGTGAKGKIDSQPGFGVEQILFNLTDPNKDVNGERSSVQNPHPFFADKAVRQAFTMAFDRKTMATQLYGVAGDPTAAILNAPASIVPTDLTWTFDLDAAGKALDAAGWSKSGQYRAKNGVQMKVLYQTTINMVRQLEQQIAKDGLEKLGCQTEIKSVDSGVYFSSDAGNPDTAAHFYADLEMFTTGPDIPDPQTYLTNWTTKQIPSKATNFQGNNYARYQNPDYDKLMDSSRTELDPAKRLQAFAQAQKILFNDAVYVGLVARKGPFGYTTGLSGFAPTPWAGLIWNLANWVKQ